MAECEENQKGFKVCSCWFVFFFNVLYRAWYVDGRILVVTVTFGIILPLCLLKNLGKMQMPLWEQNKGAQTSCH